MLDIELNGGTGLEVLSSIQVTNPVVFTVLMTGYSEMLETMQASLAAGRVVGMALCTMFALSVSILSVVVWWTYRVV